MLATHPPRQDAKAYPRHLHWVDQNAPCGLRATAPEFRLLR